MTANESNLPFGLTPEQIDGATYEASEQQDEVFTIAFLRRIEARLQRKGQPYHAPSEIESEFNRYFGDQKHYHGTTPRKESLEMFEHGWRCAEGATFDVDTTRFSDLEASVLAIALSRFLAGKPTPKQVEAAHSACDKLFSPPGGQ